MMQNRLSTSSKQRFRVWFVALVALTISLSATMSLTSQPQGKSSDSQGKSGKDDDWDDDNRDHSHASYAIGLWGDMPYSDVQAKSGVPNLLRDMNSQRLAFTVNDGDLKAGSGSTTTTTPTTCSNAMYQQALGFLNALNAPAAVTPGDNDWTDCDRTANGPYNSLERLDYERKIFFSTPFSLGQRQLRQAVQSDPKCLGFKTGTGPLDLNGNGLDPGTYNMVSCVENRRWTYRGVTYATLNIQGSCDNRCGDHADPTEAIARNAANIAWMRETFEVAKDRDSAGVMLIGQADPGFDRTDPTRSPLRDPKTLLELDADPDGFQAFMVALRNEVKSFRRPVAYVHGDSHYFRVDKPLYDDYPTDAVPPMPVNTTPASPSQARRIENFTRVETFGDNAFSGANNVFDNNNVHWVKVLVDPDSREVFAYQPQIVPENRVVVPAP